MADNTNPFEEIFLGALPVGVGTDPMEEIFLGPLDRRRSVAEKSEGLISEFTTGVRRGIKQTKALVRGGLAAGQSALGFDEAAERNILGYQQLIEEAAQFEPRVARVEDVHNMGDFAALSASLLGENVPVIASILASGGAGGILTRLVGKKLITDVAKRQLAGRIGASVGAYGGATTIGTGEIFGEQIEEDLDLDSTVALVGGTISGALELLPIVTVAKRFGIGEAFTSEFMKNMMRLGPVNRRLAFGTLIAGQEAGTEALQEVVNLTARSIVDSEFDTLGEEGKSRLLNAAVGGAIVGGAVGGIIGPGKARPEEKESAFEGMTAPPERVIPQLEYRKKDYPLVPTIIEGGPLSEGPAGSRFYPPVPTKDYLPVPTFQKSEELREMAQRAEQEINLGLPFLPPETKVRTRKGPENIYVIGERGQLDLIKGLEENVLLMDPASMTLADRALKQEIERRLRVGEERRIILPKEKAAPQVEIFVPELYGEVRRDRAQRAREVQKEKRLEARERRVAEVAQQQEAANQVEEMEQAEQVSEVTKKRKPRRTRNEIIAERKSKRDFKQFLIANELQEENLTPAEARALERLIVKEAEEGLTPRDYVRIEKIIARSVGETSQFVPSDPETLEPLGEVKEIETVTKTSVFQKKRETAKQRKGMRKGAVPLAEVKRIVQQFRDEHPLAPEIVILGDPEVPLENISREILEKAQTSVGMVDFKTPGIVYIVPGNMVSVQELQETLLHEILVHSGFRGIFTESELVAFLDAVSKSFDIRLIADQYDLDIGAFDVDKDTSRLTEKQKLNVLGAAEELVAQMAESGTQMSLLDRIVAMIYRAFRRIFKADLKLSRAEVRRLLVDIDTALRGQVINPNPARNLSGVFAPYVDRQSAEFRKWFGNSKAKDAEGNPRRYYYFAEDNGLEILDPTAQESELMFFSPDPEFAFGRLQGKVKEGYTMYPVFLRAERMFDPRNPAHIEKLITWRRRQFTKAGVEGTKLQTRIQFERERIKFGSLAVMDAEFLRAHGFDSVLVDPNLKVSSIGVLRANQVKSAIGNVGTWSSESDSILQSLSAEARAIVGESGLPKDRAAELGKQIQKLTSIWKRRIFGVTDASSAMRMFFTPLQITKKVDLEPVTQFLRMIEQAHRAKTTVILKAQTVNERWRKVGKEKATLLSKALTEIYVESLSMGRRFTKLETDLKLKNRGLNEELAALYYDIRNSFDELLGIFEKELIREAIEKEMAKDPTKDAVAFMQEWESATTDEQIALIQREGKILEAASPKIEKIKNQMRALSNSNYFPLARFGRKVVSVVANRNTVYKGRRVEAGEPVIFEAFESTKAQQEAFERLSKMEGEDFHVRQSEMSDAEFAFFGLPPELMYSDSAINELSDEQKKLISFISLRLPPGKDYLKDLSRRKGVDGYSEDARRVFAAYFVNAAGHLARLQYHGRLKVALDNPVLSSKTNIQERAALINEGMRPGIKNLVGLNPGRDDRFVMDLYNYFSDHLDYFLTPSNDLAAVRAFAFNFYLGALPKSAFVNLTQIPMVTYPYLSARYGDVATVGAITRSYKTIVGMLVKGKSDLTDVEDLMITRAIEEGFLNESLATELTETAESPTLMRIMPDGPAERLLNNWSYYSSFLFSKAEHFNRRVSFLSAFRLAKSVGLSDELAFAAGKDSVQTTQYEYAKWNRAAFMRGKKSVIFLFWNYMQHATYLAFGGAGAKTAVRFWMALFLFSGLQGLPYAENVFDIFDAVATKFKEAFGASDPRTRAREEIRELALSLDANPDMVMHGLGRYYGLGPMHLLSAFGIPVPNTDISGSLSLGRVIPGTEDLLGYERDPEKRLARTLLELGGPVAGIGYGLWQLVFEDHPDEWKQWERAMPSALKAGSKMLRWSITGEERLSTGAVIQDFEDMPNRAQTLLAQGLGFAPTALNQKYERRAAQEDARRYFLVRRQLLMEDFGYAKLLGDREGVADAKQAIAKFNQSVPHALIKINADDLKRSLRQRLRLSRLEAAGLGQEKRFRNLRKETGALFPVQDETAP